MFLPQSVERLSTLTRAFIRLQLKALSAVALKAADGVPAEVFTAAVVNLALVNIWEKQATAFKQNSGYKSAGSVFQCAVRLCDGLIVGWKSDLCMFFHPAAVWNRRGSCSARLWMCLYRCSHNRHCSRHRFLQLQHIHHYVWITFHLLNDAELLLYFRYTSTKCAFQEHCALKTSGFWTILKMYNLFYTFSIFFVKTALKTAFNIDRY